MRTLFSRKLASGLIGLGLLAAGATTLQAAPLQQPELQAPAAASNALQVRDAWNGERSNQWRRHGWNGDRQWRGRDQWQGRQWQGRHWNRGGWHGRRHNDRAYYGLGGFGLGLGLGLAAPRYYDNYYYAPPRRTYRGLSSAHIRWCSARYRTYRAWDNTYVPRVGYRAVCYSPYG